MEYRRVERGETWHWMRGRFPHSPSHFKFLSIRHDQARQSAVGVIEDLFGALKIDHRIIATLAALRVLLGGGASRPVDHGVAVLIPRLEARVLPSAVLDSLVLCKEEFAVTCQRVNHWPTFLSSYLSTL